MPDTDVLTPVNTRKMTDAQRAEIVIQSLKEPHLMDFAHRVGINNTTLSHWRSHARSGTLEVPGWVREALQETMVQCRFTGRRKGGQHKISPSAAAAAVEASVHRPVVAVAKAFGISTSYLSTLRALARNGRLEVSDRARTTLQATRRDPDQKPARRPKAPATAEKRSKTPILDALTAQPAAQPIAHRAAPALPAEDEPAPITLSRKGLRIEVPHGTPMAAFEALIETLQAR